MNVNTQYKASVFSLLFGEPDTARELYAALSGTAVDPQEPVRINTLQDALFMERINDLSFLIGDRLVILVEHQSTINENMALRLLLYIVRIYEKLLNSNKSNLYSSKLIKLARPEFFVLYNGPDEYPDVSEIRLSDAFIDKTDKPRLELIVKVYNINNGRNPDMLKKSAALSGYATFIKAAREFEAAAGSRELGIEQAVKYCIQHDILKKFMLNHGIEVVNMLFNEWNWDDAKKVWKEEAATSKEKDDVVHLAEYGMLPQQIAQALKLPPAVVNQYLGI
jgi:hypothetical protein